jgi:DNA-binding transcriptional ArsR family regulator
MKLRERVIDLSTHIAALRAEIDEKRTEVVGMERELDSLLNQRTDMPVIPTTVPMVPTISTAPIPTAVTNSNPSSIGDRIKTILEAESDGEYQAEDFEHALKDVSMPSIRAALSRMTDDGIIVRLRRGFYQAKTQA